MDARNSTVAVDFDGTLRDKGSNLPVPGALEALESLRISNEVVVFTARADLDAVRIWLEDNRFPKLKVVNRKPVAKYYIDDHAVRFDGSWPETMAMLPRLEKGWDDGR